MSKLDEAWEKFHAAREGLRAARDLATKLEEAEVAIKLNLEAAKLEAARLVADADKALADAGAARARASEEIERAKARLRAASDKIAPLVHAEVAGACGKDPRSDVEKALDNGTEFESTAVPVLVP